MEVIRRILFEMISTCTWKAHKKQFSVIRPVKRKLNSKSFLNWNAYPIPTSSIYIYIYSTHTYTHTCITHLHGKNTYIYTNYPYTYTQHIHSYNIYMQLIHGFSHKTQMHTHIYMYPHINIHIYNIHMHIHMYTYIQIHTQDIINNLGPTAMEKRETKSFRMIIKRGQYRWWIVENSVFKIIILLKIIYKNCVDNNDMRCDSVHF